MRKLPRFRITAATLALAFALGAAGIASAQAPGLVAPVPQDTGRLYGFAGFAAFGPEKNSGLDNERGTLSNFIGGAGYHAWPNWAVEANVLIDTRKLDTPAGVVAQLPAGAFQPGTAKSTISSSGLAVSAKYRFSGGPLVPYLGGGMGLYTTRFSTTTEAPGCSQRCYDTGARIRARSTDLGFHVFAGGEFRITANDAFAAELRYLQLDADFGTTLPGKTKVGGAFLWAGYRRAFF